MRRSIFRILRANVLCSIATVTADQRSHINTAYFAYTDALELYFLSDPRSRHCRNLRRNPSAAIAVFPSAQKWGGPDRGLQLFGTCRLVTGAALDGAQRIYVKRFPRYGTYDTSDYSLYRFTTRSLKILDEREFGEATFVKVNVRRR